jgi:hypothetical protein
VDIVDVDVIDPAEAARLQDAGVDTAEQLLGRCREPGSTAALAVVTGIPARRLAELARTLELMRVEGVAAEQATLLLAAGVDSPAELARRNAEVLAETLHELTRIRATGTAGPDAAEVAAWVARARDLS